MLETIKIKTWSKQQDKKGHRKKQEDQDNNKTELELIITIFRLENNLLHYTTKFRRCSQFSTLKKIHKIKNFYY